MALRIKLKVVWQLLPQDFHFRKCHHHHHCQLHFRRFKLITDLSHSEIILSPWIFAKQSSCKNWNLKMNISSALQIAGVVVIGFLLSWNVSTTTGFPDSVRIYSNNTVFVNLFSSFYFIDLWFINFAFLILARIRRKGKVLC